MHAARRGAERREQAAAGQQDRAAGRGLQEGRRRPAREPVVRADGNAAGRAAPCSPTTIRTCRGCPKMRHHDVPDMASCPLTPEYLAAQDCVLIATDHSAYDYDFIVQHARLVIDTRNATKMVAQRAR